MIRRLLSVLLGAAIAIEADRWWERRRAHYTPNALTGRLLDTVNRRLERRSGGTGTEA
jgi:hypothetical protein